MKEKKTNKGLVIVIICLLLVIVGLSGFIVYDKVLKNSKSEVSGQNNEFLDNEKVEEQKDLEVSESEAKNMYYKIFNRGKEQKMEDIGFCGSYVPAPYSFYANKKIVINEDGNYKELMEMALQKIPDNKKETSSKKSGGATIYTEKFLVSDIKAAYKSLFGEPKEFKNFGIYKIEGEYYIGKAKYYIGSGDECMDRNLSFLSTFKNYETDKENLYIYDKAIYYFEEYNENDDIERKFYNSINGNQEIVDLRNKNKEVILDDAYSDKMLLYKHTFKQNSDGTFYLYSSEPV